MFKTVLGMDLGSKYTKLALKEGCFCEPTIVSIGAGENRVRSVGYKAEFAEHCRLSPIKNGCCSNAKLLALMLDALCKKYCGKKGFHRNPVLCCALSKTMPFHRVMAFERAAEAAGFREFHVLSRSLMGAVGAGLDVKSDKAAMIVNIGAETVNCAAIGFGGLIYECSENFGSGLCERAIQKYFEAVHSVSIGTRVAELIKLNLNRPDFAVDGRPLKDGLPKTIRLDAQSIRAATMEGAEMIVSFAADMLSHLRADICEDIFETGIILIGGGAKMYGICELFESRLGIKTAVAENAEMAVSDGMRQYLFTEKESLRDLSNGYTKMMHMQIRYESQTDEALINQ